MQPTYNIDNPNLACKVKQELWKTRFALRLVELIFKDRMVSSYC